MKYIIFSGIGMILSIWLGAFSIEYFTSPAYEYASFLTALLLFSGSAALPTIVLL